MRSKPAGEPLETGLCGRCDHITVQGIRVTEVAFKVRGSEKAISDLKQVGHLSLQHGAATS